jgi:hypothetical protein
LFFIISVSFFLSLCRRPSSPFALARCSSQYTGSRKICTSAQQSKIKNESPNLRFLIHHHHLFFCGLEIEREVVPNVPTRNPMFQSTRPRHSTRARCRRSETQLKSAAHSNETDFATE